MKRSFRVVVLAVLALLLLGPVPDSLARQKSPRLPAGRSGAVPKAIEAAADTSAAYATGTAIHADALRAGDNALIGLDVAFSGAAFSSAPVTTEYVNEVQRLVVPGLGAKAAFGRGTGLELGLGSTPVPLIGQLSQAAAPPSTGLIHKVVGPIGVPGVLTAELLRSQAQSRAADGCVLGPDQSYGLGSVLDLEVLGGLLAITEATPPQREVVQSSSTTRIVPGSQPGRLALKSETRQTIAPVTFFKGAPIQFTVEVLGEWALRATADGAQGNVHYGPLADSPETPVVRVLDAKGAVVAQLTTQMIPLLGDEGLVVEIPGVAEIAIGEDPRLTGGDASTAPVVEPTRAVAAVDVVRVRLLDGALGDVRIGHMEAAVTVPAGGVQCPGLIVDHDVDKPTVTPGGEFIYTITVTNPHDCVLADVRLVDTPTLPAGVKLQVVSMTPPGGESPAGVVTGGDLATFPDLGPLAPGQTKTVTIKVNVPLDSAPGKITAVAVVTGLCPVDPHDSTNPDLNLPGPPSTPDIPVRGEDSVDGPTIGVCVVPSLPGLTLAEAEQALVAAGCILGDVTGDPNAGEDDVGKVTGQDPGVDTSVPLGTPVDVTIGGELCTVPPLAGLTPDQADDALEAAGCDLGTVTTGPPGTTGDPGDITTQNPPAGDQVPVGTKVDVVIAPPASCVVPNVAGLTQEQAAAALIAAGCILGDVTTRPDADPDQTGKVVDQGTPPGTSVPAGTDVDITVGGPGTAVLGETVTRADNPGPGGVGTEVQTGTLARTGGVAALGLALWLVVTGLMGQAAGSPRLWRLARRRG